MHRHIWGAWYYGWLVRWVLFLWAFSWFRNYSYDTYCWGLWRQCITDIALECCCRPDRYSAHQFPHRSVPSARSFVRCVFSRRTAHCSQELLARFLLFRVGENIYIHCRLVLVARGPCEVFRGRFHNRFFSPLFYLLTFVQFVLWRERQALYPLDMRLFYWITPSMGAWRSVCLRPSQKFKGTH